MACASTLKFNVGKMHQAECTCTRHVQSADSCISAWEFPVEAQKPQAMVPIKTVIQVNRFLKRRILLMSMTILRC